MFAVVGRVYRHGLLACDACKAAKTRWGVELAEHFETLGFNGFDHGGPFSLRVAGGVRWDSRCGRNRLFLGGLTATGGEQQGGRKQYCSGVHSCHPGTSLVGWVGGLEVRKRGVWGRGVSVRVELGG